MSLLKSLLGTKPKVSVFISAISILKILELKPFIFANNFSIESDLEYNIYILLHTLNSI